MWFNFFFLLHFPLENLILELLVAEGEEMNEQHWVQKALEYGERGLCLFDHKGFVV